jgi:hypothetical protein
MRKIDWEGPLSDEDVVWLHTTGQPGIEERIERHQAQFGADVPEIEVPADELSKSALDPTARSGELVESAGGPKLVDPTKADAPDDEDDSDDYDTWNKADLESEVEARNGLDNRKTDVEVVGTGKDGAVLKADMIKGLRLWDLENPGVL